MDKKIEPMDALLEGLEKLGQDRILKDLEAINAAYVRLFITIPEQLSESATREELRHQRPVQTMQTEAQDEDPDN